LGVADLGPDPRERNAIGSADNDEENNAEELSCHKGDFSKHEISMLGSRPFSEDLQATGESVKTQRDVLPVFRGKVSILSLIYCSSATPEFRVSAGSWLKVSRDARV
jgi:hypothetical protein